MAKEKTKKKKGSQTKKEPKLAAFTTFHMQKPQYHIEAEQKEKTASS